MDHNTSHYHPHKNHPPKHPQLGEIEVLIISAENLKNVKHITKMRTYAAVYVEKSHVTKTHVDRQGGTEPTWNEVVKVKFREDILSDGDVTVALNVDIYAYGHVREKPVGSARVLLCDVLKGGKPDGPDDNPIQCMTVQVWRPSGRPHGLLNLWVPATGRFLMRRESSNTRVKEFVEEERKEEVEVVETVVDGGGSGGGDMVLEVS